jgi:tetratricopeptide (TPR) repeat protein
MRWAYRDPTLKAYYLNMFSGDKVQRGPLYFFVASGDTLAAMDQGPDFLKRIGFSMMLNEDMESARDALALYISRNPADSVGHYWLAWAHYGLGDKPAALASLERAGVAPIIGPATGVNAAMVAVTAGDTLGALELAQGAAAEHGLDPVAHALVADLLLILYPGDPAGAVEAFAARVLDPQQPFAWRRWAMVQTQRERFLEAVDSFERYFELGGAAARGDEEAKRWVANIRAMLPGGEEAGERLRQ